MTGKLQPDESKEKLSGTTTKSERFGDKGRSRFICEVSSATFSAVSARVLPGFTVPYMHSKLSVTLSSKQSNFRAKGTVMI